MATTKASKTNQQTQAAPTSALAQTATAVQAAVQATPGSTVGKTKLAAQAVLANAAPGTTGYGGLALTVLPNHCVVRKGGQGSYPATYTHAGTVRNVPTAFAPGKLTANHNPAKGSMDTALCTAVQALLAGGQPVPAAQLAQVLPWPSCKTYLARGWLLPA